MSVAGAKQNCALDQWTALPDQCLHSAEADVRPPRRKSGFGGWPVNGAPPFSLPDAGDSTAVRLSAPGAVRHDVANQVAHVVLQISDDVLDDVSHRDHAHDLARVQHW